MDKREYPNGGGSLNEYTSKTLKLLRLQSLTRLKPPPLSQEEEFLYMSYKKHTKKAEGDPKVLKGHPLCFYCIESVFSGYFFKKI